MFLIHWNHPKGSGCLPCAFTNPSGPKPAAGGQPPASISPPPMLIRLRRQIVRAASLKAALVLFICLLPFNLLLFPAREQRLEAYLGYQTAVLDARLYYSPDQAYRYFSDLGSPGRQL